MNLNDEEGPLSVSFREITRDELKAVCDLVVAPEQSDLVTPNVMTMAEAPFEPGALVRAMWQGERVVGLLAMLRPSAYPEDEDIVIRRDAAYVWRLMVGARFQGQGLGILALDEAKRTAAAWGYRGMTLTVAGKPHSALPFYEKYGFVRTGRMLWDDENELEMVCWFAD
ncbi:MAG: GNAT family N-acetyltransferase [Rhizobiaceae bacterium]|nr:GNAT family N-acetyltransferase [Rhizobiaceae bacterium]